MVRFIADEHVREQLVHKLRLLGHDVSTVRGHSENKAGDGMDDAEVVQLALNESRIVITYNKKDFLAIASEKPWHRGIVCVSQENTDFKSISKAIDDFAKLHGNHTAQVCVIGPNSELTEYNNET